MRVDDLNKPLGYAPRAHQEAQHAPMPARMPMPLRDMPWGGLALCGIGLIAASLVAFTYVTERAVTPPAPAPALAANVDYAPPRRISVPDFSSAASSLSEADSIVSVSPGVRILSTASDQDSQVKIISRTGADGSDPIVIRVPQETRAQAALSPAPDARLVASGPHGPLPRIARDGARPADVYARPAGLDARLPPGAPRLALVVNGMGINPQASAQAVKILPPAITLAYSPYAPRIEDQAEQARLAGHELLLQVPMEGFAPSQELGARGLMASASRERNRDALDWHMSRFQGYIGLTNYLGGRFMASTSALMPLLQNVAERGLMFFDDGTARQSLTSALALATGAPSLRADLALEATTPDGMDTALRRLESLAREKGIAIGVAPAVPAHVDRIARFAQGLEARGIALVPLSALFPAPARTVAR
jgi:polysaccharide deacetylase 2 family uncharacterized protein YibQ